MQCVQTGVDNIELYAPDEASLRQAYEKGEIPFPYWGRVWPAAKALAQWLYRHPENVQGKNIIELGAGLGLPSLVASQWALSVLCTDVDAHALEYVSRSARHLGFQNLNTKVLDWHQIPEDVSADIVLMSDVNYNPDAFPELLQTIKYLLQNKSIAILSTPQRLMAKPFVEALMPYVVQKQTIEVEQTSVTVFKLAK